MLVYEIMELIVKRAIAVGNQLITEGKAEVDQKTLGKQNYDCLNIYKNGKLGYQITQNDSSCFLV